VPTALALLSGAAWTVTYIACIVLGLRHRTYCMPAVPLALNFSWECVYAVQGLRQPFTVQTGIDVVWAVFDAVIIVTFLRFGRAEQPRLLPRARFLSWTVLLLATAFAVQLLFIHEFGPHAATRYSAFLMNVVMSIAFLGFWAARPARRGQSLVIAWSKFVGTLAATALFGVVEDSAFILGLGMICAVFDALYVLVLLHRADPDQTGSAPEQADDTTARTLPTTDDRRARPAATNGRTAS